MAGPIANEGNDPKEMITMVSTTAPAVRLLAPTDRCDRCGARGYVVAVFHVGDLVFCAHHGRQYADSLMATAVLIYDESDHAFAA